MRLKYDDTIYTYFHIYLNCYPQNGMLRGNCVHRQLENAKDYEINSYNEYGDVTLNSLVNLPKSMDYNKIKHVIMLRDGWIYIFKDDSIYFKDGF